MHAERQIEAQLSLALRPARARALWLVGLCVTAVFAWYHQTFADMAGTWWRTETYAHGLVVLPLFAYLVWRGRDRLATVPLQPWWAALAGLALAGFVWLLGDLSATIGVSQFAMVAMVPLTIAAILGRAAVRALLFPLAFLFFAVPFGSFLLPTLMTLTADFTVGALRLSGVPVYREGMMFFIPSGAWSVVEACSGLRYLIASVMIGTLYAYLTYRSLRRRLLFLGVAIAVPLLANWLRAYLIVMLGHLSDNRIAAGVDHLIYGWLFFGLVTGVMYWIGARWREDLDDRQPAAATAAETPAPASRVNLAAVAAAVVLVALWRPAAEALATTDSQGPIDLAVLAPTANWVEGLPFTNWTPVLNEPAASLQQVFSKGDGSVGLHVAYYKDQNQQSEAVTGEGLQSAHPDWRRISTTTLHHPVAGEEASVVRNELVHPRERLVVWSWYWMGGRMTANPYAAKAYLAWARLTGQGDDAAAIVLYTQRRDTTDAADERLAAFVAEMSPQLLIRLQEAQRP